MRITITLLVAAFVALAVAREPNDGNVHDGGHVTEHAASWWDSIRGKHHHNEQSGKHNGHQPGKHGEHQPGKQHDDHNSVHDIPKPWHGPSLGDHPVDEYGHFHAHQGHHGSNQHYARNAEFFDDEDEFFDASDFDHYNGEDIDEDIYGQPIFAREVVVDPSEAENSADQVYYDSNSDGDDEYLANAVTDDNTYYPNDDSGDIDDEEFDEDLEYDDDDDFVSDDEDEHPSSITSRDLEDEEEYEDEYDEYDDDDEDVEEPSILTRGLPQKLKNWADVKDHG